MGNHNSRTFSLTAISIILLVLSGCGRPDSQKVPLETNTPIQPSPTATILSTPTEFTFRTAWWVTYAGLSWKPESDPYVDDHFIVYSDTAEVATKERYGQECQLAFERILGLISTTEELEGINFFPSKIEVFVRDEDLANVDWRGISHFNGILVTYNPSYYVQMVELFPDDFPDKYLISHELGHVIIFRITNNTTSSDSLTPHPWYNEGLASFLAEQPNPIRSRAQYLTKMQEAAHFPENGNPISFRDPSYVPLDYPYELWELSVYYLIETYGMESVIGILIDMRNGFSFEQGFEKRIGMMEDEYQENFDTLIRDFVAKE